MLFAKVNESILDFNECIICQQDLCRNCVVGIHQIVGKPISDDNYSSLKLGSQLGVVIIASIVDELAEPLHGMPSAARA